MAPKKGSAADSGADSLALLGRAKNNLCMGIVGLPNVGKSLTFTTLTKVAVPSENFPFCTIDPNSARVAVPDKRFEWLCEYYKPASKVPAYLDVVDIAGLIKGASEGLGLGNAFLSHIKASDGIYHVVRVFPDEDVSHVEGDVDPVRDIDIIVKELVAKDLEFLGARLEDVDRRAARQEKGLEETKQTLLKVKKLLEDGADLFAQSWSPKEVAVLNELQLLSCKPVVYLLNMSEADFCRQRNKHLVKIKEHIVARNPNAPIIPYSASLEAHLLSLETDAERAEYLAGLKDKYSLEAAPESALDKIVKTGYKALSLIHFFTAGADEVRCWTVRKYTKAPDAAGTIHTDFHDFFICAEVFTYKDLKKLGSEAEVRANGKVRTEGKEYIVEDGDIMYFKHNARGGASKKK